MKHVSKRDALCDMNKFLREMYYWCDLNGSYENKTPVSVSRDTIRKMHQLINAVLEADANGTDIIVADGYDSVFAQLKGLSNE